MAADDLTAPLGKNKPGNRRFALPIGIPHLVAGLLGLPLIVFMGWAIVRDDPLGGEPMTTAPSNPRPEAGASAKGANTDRPADRPTRADKNCGQIATTDRPQAGSQSEPEPPAGSKTVTIIDGSGGKRQRVGDPKHSSDKPVEPAERLTEPSARPLRNPRDGVRPADALRGRQGVPRTDAPRIAIVVGGLGSSGPTPAMPSSACLVGHLR